MNKQLMKTYNGYAVTYHSTYKVNPFVFTCHGKVVIRFADFQSAMLWVINEMTNFERMGER